MGLKHVIKLSHQQSAKEKGDLATDGSRRTIGYVFEDDTNQSEKTARQVMLNPDRNRKIKQKIVT